MPLGDEKHNQIYKELVNILGPDCVEDDPAVMEAFYRDGLTPQFLSRGRAEFIVLPGSTDDVQQNNNCQNKSRLGTKKTANLSLVFLSALFL